MLTLLLVLTHLIDTNALNKMTSPPPHPPPLRGRGGWGVKRFNAFVLVAFLVGIIVFKKYIFLDNIKNKIIVHHLCVQIEFTLFYVGD
jgi:hypothetical protein